MTNHVNLLLICAFSIYDINYGLVFSFMFIDIEYMMNKLDQIFLVDMHDSNYMIVGF